MVGARAALCRHRWALIFGLALVVRLALVAILGPRVGIDSGSYMSRAQHIASTGPAALLGLPLEHSPLYSVFLVPGALLGLDLAWYAAAAQAVLGAMTAVVLARIAERGTGRTAAGVLTGLIAAVHFTFPFWGAYVLSDTLFLFIVAVTADRVLDLYRTAHPFRSATIAGALLLLSLVSRPTAVSLVVAVGVFLIMAARGSAERSARLAAGVMLPATLMIAAWVGAASLGRAPAPLSTFERVAAWGNSAVYGGLVWTEEGRSTYGVDVGVEPPPVLASMTPEERATFTSMDPARDPFAFIRAQPSFFARQAVRKAAMFWTPVLPEFSLRHAAIAVVYFVPLYLLALAGLVDSATRRAAFAALCGLIIASIFLLCLVTFVDYDQRYRLPVELFLVPLAGAGLALLWSRRPAAFRIAARPGRVASERII